MFSNGIQRNSSSVPKYIVILFLCGLSLQFVFANYYTERNITAQKLSMPPTSDVLSIVSFGEPAVLSKFLMLSIQAFDNQPGVSIPFSEIDYETLIKWLNRIVALDERSKYPLLVASRIYTEVPDEKKIRMMMDFVYKQFLKNPKQNWSWLANVTVLAKHRLKDYTLALKFARVLADKKFSKDIPNWARQLEIVILEDMGERDTVLILLGGLIESGSITDYKELLWLEQRLKKLESDKK